MLSVKSSRDKSLTITKHVSKSTEVILFIGVTDPFDIAGFTLRPTCVNHVYIRRGFGQRHELLVKATNIIQTGAN